MKFNSDDPKWTAYVLGELSSMERAAVEKELESSAVARDAVEEIRMTTALLRDELERTAPAGLLKEQRMAIHAGAAPGRRFRSAALVFAGAAACLVIAVIGTSSLLPRQPTENLPAASPVTSPSVVGRLSDEPVIPAALPSDESEGAGPGKEKQQQEQPPQEVQSAQVAASELRQEPAVSTDTNMPPRSGILSGLLGGIFNTRNEAAQTSSPEPASLPGAGGVASLQQPTLVEKDTADAEKVRFAQETRMLADASAAITSFMPAPDIADRPRFNTEAYDQITDNPFIRVTQDPLATFSTDVDTASYANVRRFLGQNQLPPRDSVRIEEMINYFSYDYPSPSGAHPVAVYTEIAAAPWKPDHRLVRIGIRGRDISMANRPSSNLVFLIDVSGSMNSPVKLPLLKSAMKLMIDQLTENDRVAIVVYAGASGLVLPPTGGDKKEQILQAIDRLAPGGSTNGAAGIQLAYETAVSQFIRGGINRVVLATDGDFNIGITNQGDLLRLIEDRARSNVFLSVLGFGIGNYKDSTLEKLADQGNGNYAYIDTLNEARKVLVEELGGTLVAIAKDVKIQIEFNPAEVNAYRLIGYENRILSHEDFNNDARDAGDMGAGHTVTALFEVVPKGVEISVPGVDPLKYQPRAGVNRRTGSAEMLNLKVRYKDPEGTESKLLETPVADRGSGFDAASTDYRFAAAVASFGMILRDSPHKGSSNLDSVIHMAETSKGSDKGSYREEFLRLVRKTRAIRDLQ